jgi:hypothetical protein
VVLYTDGGYPSAAMGLTFAGYAQAGGNFMVMGYALDAFDSFLWQTLHVYNASVYSGEGWIGMTGQEGTAYEGLTVPVIPAYATGGRFYHRVYSEDDECEEIFAQINVGGDTRNCLVIWRNPDKGNAGVVVGQSMPFLDQAADDVKTLGDMILGDEFGETK